MTQTCSMERYPDVSGKIKPRCYSCAKTNLTHTPTLYSQVFIYTTDRDEQHRTNELVDHCAKCRVSVQPRQLYIGMEVSIT